MASQVSAMQETEALGRGKTGSRWAGQEGVGSGLEAGLGLPSFLQRRQRAWGLGKGLSGWGWTAGRPHPPCVSAPTLTCLPQPWMVFPSPCTPGLRARAVAPW